MSRRQPQLKRSISLAASLRKVLLLSITYYITYFVFACFMLVPFIV